MPAAMSTETVTTRELCTYIGDDSKESLDRIQTWVGLGLFDLVDCGPVEKYTDRGRAREYPAAARYWCALFRRLFDRGFTTRDLVDLINPIMLRGVEDPGFVQRTATEGRPVWLSHIRTPNPATPGAGLDHAPGISAASRDTFSTSWTRQPVWLSHIRPGAGLDRGSWTIADDVPSIPREWGAWKGIVRCVDLGWLFSRGHE
jgi:hypothetical protein